MAEINNSLALGIKNDPVDIGKVLQQAAGINSLRASTAQTEQETKYRQFQQDQGGGYRVPDLNILAETHQKQMDIGGRIGNILEKDQSLAARKQAIQMSHQAGRPVDQETEQHLLTAPASQVKQYGLNMQRGGQNSTSNIEQDPGQIAQRNQAGTGGSELGTMYGPPGYGGKSGKPGAGEGPKGLMLGEQKAEALGSAGVRVKEFEGYKNEAEAANEKNVALRQILVDADRVRTGKGETKINDAKKWMQTIGEYVPGMKDYVDKNLKDPVAAFESLEKNRGIVARAAMKGVGGTAASELEAISGSLASGETSHKGIDVNVSQLIGLENAKKARFAAAQAYQDRFGSLKGFAADFNKNAGPAAWVFMSLPAEERQSIRESLQKTKQGQGVLQSLGRQLNYIHTNKLDEGVE